jgi:hypothetical protein
MIENKDKIILFFKNIIIHKDIYDVLNNHHLYIYNLYYNFQNNSILNLRNFEMHQINC